MQLAGRFEWRKWRQITEDAGASFGLSPSRVVVLENHAFSTVHTALHVFLRLCGSLNRLGAETWWFVVIQYVYLYDITTKKWDRGHLRPAHIALWWAKAQKGQRPKVRAAHETEVSK